MSAVAGAPARARLRVRTACPGCGLPLALHGGPTHAYLGASPACWRLYSKLSADPFARSESTRLRRLVVGAYSAQHPGTEHRRAMQSVAVHLMGLCMLLERDGASRRPEPVLGRMPARKPIDLHWLAPPDLRRCMTAADVLAAGPGDAYAAAAEAWAKSVWAAWRPHHDTVRDWLDAPGRPAAG